MDPARPVDNGGAVPLDGVVHSLLIRGFTGTGQSAPTSLAAPATPLIRGYTRSHTPAPICMRPNRAPITPR
ncbi:hypothetical protein GCM10010219_31160 [Streptomyces netropsis]|nr:hypothetical protein GCM10010219_31160 [Streptomyces netropsis]